jgi:hypothetical protein
MDFGAAQESSLPQHPLRFLDALSNVQIAFLEQQLLANDIGPRLDMQRVGESLEDSRLSFLLGIEYVPVVDANIADGLAAGVERHSCGSV